MTNIVPYVMKYKRHPVSGQPLALKDLIKLNFHKNGGTTPNTHTHTHTRTHTEREISAKGAALPCANVHANFAARLLCSVFAYEVRCFACV